MPNQQLSNERAEQTTSSLLETDREESSTDTTSGADFSGSDLTIGYPTTDEPVIGGESITVPPGEVTALVGPNGSGKSTLLKGLATQLDLDEGTVLLDGGDVHQMGGKELARSLGLLSQENTAPDSLTVEDLVYHGRYPHRSFFEMVTEDDETAVEEALELAGVTELRDRELSSLSGGQKQLVWIAMILAQDTDVLLLDEPTTFLDLQHQLEVMEIVETLRDQSDVTVVLVLHDIEQAARYADNLLALDDGSIYARGSPEDVLTEDLLAEVFGIEARVTSDEKGPQITPLRPLDGQTRDERDDETESKESPADASTV